MARERGSVRAERSLKGRTDGRAVEADPRPPAPHTDLLPPRVRSAGEGPEAERSGLRGVPIPGGEAGARRLLRGKRRYAVCSTPERRQGDNGPRSALPALTCQGAVRPRGSMAATRHGPARPAARRMDGRPLGATNRRRGPPRRSQWAAAPRARPAPLLKGQSTAPGRFSLSSGFRPTRGGSGAVPRCAAALPPP